MREMKPAEIENLETATNSLDLRRDVHLFARYVGEREVKRRHRDNGLPKVDAARLAKLISDPEAKTEVKELGDSNWLDYVDWLALKLGFVSYDTKGEYVGYSSSERSYPDNYIRFDEEKYRRFLQAGLDHQERVLLDTLLKQDTGTDSEFYRTGVLGRLTGFDSHGCAMGVAPSLDYPRARRFLLGLLRPLEVGRWYSTESLIALIGSEHPFFLIPPDTRDRYGDRIERYKFFREGKKQYQPDRDISARAPDAFERVEGRYVERFLEGIPLVLGYVDVAYARDEAPALYPPRDRLRAFRVTRRLAPALEGELPPPRATVQPNFDLVVESDYYPASLLAKLEPFTELVSEGSAFLLKLTKASVSAAAAKDAALDVRRVLEEMTGRELPQNVRRELGAWTEHSEKFTLYRGFGLLEGKAELPEPDGYTVDRLSPSMRVVRGEDRLFGQLEEAGLVPLRVRHRKDGLATLPAYAKTVFPKEGRRKERATPPRPSATVKRQTTVTLHFPDASLHGAFRKAMTDLRCPIETDNKRRTVEFLAKHEPEAQKALKSLGKDYRITVEDLE